MLDNVHIINFLINIILIIVLEALRLCAI